jgi:hypothetical protein
MSLSQEALELVAKGLGLRHPLVDKPIHQPSWADSPVDGGWWSGTRSIGTTPDLAAACKAKLRESRINYTIYCGLKHSSAVISTWDRTVSRLSKRNVLGGATAPDDDLALIEAFALAVKAGAL